VATASFGTGERPSLDISHVTAALSDWVGIPAEKLSGAARAELADLEDVLARRVKGQDHCIRKLSDVIRVTKLGLDERPARPDGVFLFVGPTGVGKSELALALADTLYGGVSRLFEFNMASYSDDDGVARLVGLKLGDVDYEGDLAAAVAKHPHSVILFERIERAHRDVAILLMQIFRQGSIVGGRGARLSFSNATIIMTASSENLVPPSSEEGAVGFGQVDRRPRDTHLKEAKAAIEAFFPADFMDGIDEVLMFDQLSEDALREIVEVHLDDIRTRLALRSIGLSVTSEAVAKIVEKGSSREYGARNLGRTVEGMLLKPLARFLIGHPGVRAVRARVVEGDIEVAEDPGPAGPAPDDSEGGSSL
jgi:ATP-dependent Clp protease ATP-binding subunit ClpA